METNLTQEQLDKMSGDMSPFGANTPPGYPSLVPLFPIRVNQKVNATGIEQAYRSFMGRQSRYHVLERYYRGNQYKMTKAKTVVRSNLCRYIVRSITAYMIGNQPSYQYRIGDSYAEKILENWKDQAMWETDKRILMDMSEFGHGFELVYLDDEMVPKSRPLKPKDTFVAVSCDVEMKPIFGAIRYPHVDPNGNRYFELYVYTATHFQIWRSEVVTDDEGHRELKWKPEKKPKPHGFNQVPIIEYKNNDEMMGDFEDILSLQDAYNALMEDRIDDKNAFAQTILMLQGVVFGDGVSEVKERSEALKDIRVLHLPEDAHAEYLTKTLDESNVQTLQDQISKDIHKLAMVPDLSDEQFSGNSSGVAMAYKLYGTDQVASEKESQFQKGFRQRCQLYDSALFNATADPNYKPKADIKEMKIDFKPNTVEDLSYMSSALTQLTGAGLMSKETAMGAISIIDDVQTELERVKKDQDEQTKRDQQKFEDYPNQFGEDEEDDGEEDQPPR